MLEYWAERLEEQSALISFLPQYFTARQARDLYNAFWGYEQDDDLVETIAETLQKAHAAIHGTDLVPSRAFTLALRSRDGMVGIDADSLTPVMRCWVRC